MPGEEGRAVARAYMDAFNSGEISAQADTFNFPHIRLAEANFVVMETRDDYLTNGARIKALLEEEGWHYTVLESIEAVQEGPDKVHLVIENTRRRADDMIYNGFKTFWIATLQDGHWVFSFGQATWRNLRCDHQWIGQSGRLRSVKSMVWPECPRTLYSPVQRMRLFWIRSSISQPNLEQKTLSPVRESSEDSAKFETDAFLGVSPDSKAGRGMIVLKEKGWRTPKKDHPAELANPLSPHLFAPALPTV